MFADALRTLENTAMTNEQWKAAIANAEKLYDVAKNKTSMEWFKIIDTYYS